MQPTYDKCLVTFTAPTSFAAEQYQGLQLTVERLAHSRNARIIAVTSPGAGDGKTLTSVNLAGTLARASSSRVLLIDADLRRPSVAGRLGIDTYADGLAELVMKDGTTIEQVAQRLDGIALDVISAGTMKPPVQKVLGSPRLKVLLEQARQRYDYVVIDTPPLIPVFDSALLADAVDGLLLVVAANKTPRKLLGEALNQLEPSKVLGIVFNRDERPLFGYYDAHYRQYFTDAPPMAQEA